MSGPDALRRTWYGLRRLSFWPSVADRVALQAALAAAVRHNVAAAHRCMVNRNQRATCSQAFKAVLPDSVLSAGHGANDYYRMIRFSVTDY